jgi:hypothetical protein
LEDSLLQILQPNRVKAAFENEDSRESSLFHLFLTSGAMDANFMHLGQVPALGGALCDILLIMLT